MKNKILLLALAVGLIGCGTEPSVVQETGLEPGVEKVIDFENNELQEIEVGRKVWKVEIANTNEERSQGLMYREKLEEGHGMLFVFEKVKVYEFWMKNTLIPLDMIWLDEDFDIVDVQTAVPCPVEEENCPTYKPKGVAKYVLEVNGGEFNK